MTIALAAALLSALSCDMAAYMIGHHIPNRKAKRGARRETKDARWRQ